MNFAEFHFIRPYWFLALIPAMLIVYLLLKNKLNQGNWSTVCDAELLPFILQEKAVHRNHWALSATAISTVLIIIALAGPTWERLPSPVFRNDAALVIALDLSQSMDASDIKPSRLDRARFKIADILKQRKDGQTALLVYAGDAFTVTPLTEDTETIASQLSALTTSIMPSQGSNTVLALKKAVELLKQTGLQDGDILLVTDGVDYDQTIDTIEAMTQYRLSILGVGTVDGAPVKVAQGGFLKDSQGNIVVPKLNSSELSQLAKKGKGLYKTISSDDADIGALLNQLDATIEREGSENTNLMIEQWNEKGPWLLLLVLPLAALNFRKGLLSLALISLLPFPETSYALEWNDLWQTQNQQAQHAYQQEKYQQAAEQFDNPQWKAAAQYKAGQLEQAIETLQHDQSATGFYNKGNALAQSKKLSEAVEAYEKSLEINPDNEDAKYNKEQVEKQLEKQSQQQGDDQKKSESDDSKKNDQENNQQGDDSESSGEQQDAEKNSASDSEQKQSNEQKQNSEEPKDSQEQQQKAEEKEPQQAESKQAAEASEYDESEQASEQWLKRIPDDPAGLLKRKFKYQYGKRNRKATNENAW
jgi:Ca-activated chloride channel family protein